MPRLLCSSSSPYSAKVRMAAAHLGYALDAVPVDTGAEPDDLIAANPLGKIPTLVTDAGEAVFDSRTIMRHIDRESGRSLYPRNARRAAEAEQLEALADGLCDCLLAHVMERRGRPADQVSQAWLDKQWRKALRALDRLNAAPPRLSGRPTAGHFALRAAIGYCDLRFAGQWERGRAKLVGWRRRFDARHPELAALAPH
ncbi:glutathione S-transferase family protein [Aquibium sp. A9E412]|uniref:glutathione S-transferase family protein n=1 Tax=Aquibium sp. A9E412 TaxID=2976767 RepID=UPI0025AECDED|nr:glutathione S-transferase family protein [Aquibium sp. A9E412]MDN2565001.1 glutathione S-transferase family protein [Aquibium sp. A9E412]